MTRRFGWILALVLLTGCLWAVSPVVAQSAPPLVAQSAWPEYPSLPGHDIHRGPGNYFSWIKLALIVLVYLVWVRLADWVNRDAIRYSEHTGLVPGVWNPLMLFAFAGGLAAVLCIPMFVGGYAAYCIAAFLPSVIYVLQRRGRIPPEARTGELFAEKIEQTSGPVELRASGDNEEQAQSNLIRARQSEVFSQTTDLLHDSIHKRTEQILLDYTRESVAARIQIDGMWHPLPVMDRPTGDAMLVVLKTLANLDPAERRKAQRGQFSARSGRHYTEFDLTSQGVQSGERVLMKLLYEHKLKLSLENLGMLPEMRQQIIEALERPGIIVVSAPYGQGLSSTWQALLNDADRFTRDWIGVVDQDDRETERENIDVHQFDSRANEAPFAQLKKLILKQPSVFVIPNPVDAKTMDLLIDQILSENRMMLTQTRAASAAEALLRVMSLSGDRPGFAKSVSAITCQRLLRKLCDACKQPVQANPKAISQMGGDPAVHTTLYRAGQLPPPEMRVDEKGQPVEMEPCASCGGIGFVGRTAVYELVLVDEEIRKQLLQEPRLDPVARVIRRQGNLTLVENAYRAVLDGRTALSEVQRVMQAKRK